MVDLEALFNQVVFCHNIHSSFILSITLGNSSWHVTSNSSTISNKSGVSNIPFIHTANGFTMSITYSKYIIIPPMPLHDTFPFPNLSYNLLFVGQGSRLAPCNWERKKLRRKNGKKFKSFDPRIEIKNKYFNF